MIWFVVITCLLFVFWVWSWVRASDAPCPKPPEINDETRN